MVWMMCVCECVELTSEAGTKGTLVKGPKQSLLKPETLAAGTVALLTGMYKTKLHQK